ncbi:putative UDP-glucuronosyl/UDP-glucosyltransferase, UDP-glycosyltransferase family [Helianthus annuus]|nr:putative UDP-glucuronosyl/UDP-glucosyltransferase, UDP-glycosyltransferase family [Helianthus annuus]
MNKSPHVLLFPFPAQGHINPLIQFGKRLVSKAFVHNYGPYPGWTGIVFNQFANIDQSRWVFSNSFYELEAEVIEWMRKMWKLKVIGPTLPSMYLDKRLEDDKDYGFNLIKANNKECMNWLDDKPEKSVVYVSFGSMAQLGLEQMEEIACGLSDCKFNFLWVVRAEEEEKLPKEFANQKITGKGLVVAWCRQLDVLAHKSVGCFITHCGFNSTLEAISLGVPVVGMPQWTDQITNAKLLDEIWDVGVRVKANEKGIVTRENLVSCIMKIMEDERGVVTRKNAAKWRELAKAAVDEGGSSDKDIDEFVSELFKA